MTITDSNIFALFFSLTFCHLRNFINNVFNIEPAQVFQDYVFLSHYCLLVGKAEEYMGNSLMFSSQ